MDEASIFFVEGEKEERKAMKTRRVKKSGTHLYLRSRDWNRGMKTKEKRNQRRRRWRETRTVLRGRKIKLTSLLSSSLYFLQAILFHRRLKRLKFERHEREDLAWFDRRNKETWEESQDRNSRVRNWSMALVSLDHFTLRLILGEKQLWSSNKT